jgi:hypothetical protein
MEKFTRVILLLLITWLLVAQVYFAAIPLGLWYLTKHRGYELIAVAILVDGYYQAFYSVPILSIATIMAVILIDLIKPQLLMYTDDNEMVS